MCLVQLLWEQGLLICHFHTFNVLFLMFFHSFWMSFQKGKWTNQSDLHSFSNIILEKQVQLFVKTSFLICFSHYCDVNLCFLCSNFCLLYDFLCAFLFSRAFSKGNYFWDVWNLTQNPRQKYGFWIDIYEFIKKNLMFVYFWEGAEGERERETQNKKQPPGSELSAQSLTRGSNPGTMRSWPELKSDA